MKNYNAMDINWWYRANEGVCPNCGLSLFKMDPAYNIYPHFAGACQKETKADYSRTSIAVN
jgi:hypothetical protein